MKNKENIIITKSDARDYYTFCPYLFWMKKHNPEALPKPDEATLFRFDQGNKVEEIARKIFIDGIEVPNKYGEVKTIENVEKTTELMKHKKPLFQAGFLAEFAPEKMLYARNDITKPSEDDSWDLIEVKMSTPQNKDGKSKSPFKKEDIFDVAFQRYVAKKSGKKIGKSYIFLVNHEFRKSGEINPNDFIKQYDVTDTLKANMSIVEENIKKMFEILINPEPPKCDFGGYCYNPYECALFNKCWSKLPENSVYELYGDKNLEKAKNLESKNIMQLKDVPEDFEKYKNNITSQKWKIQIKCAKTGKPHVNFNEIKKFHSKIKFPIHYFDLETHFNVAVPLHDRDKPYERVPFQYSLHIVDNKNASPKHYSFLHKDTSDPRLEFINSMKKHFKDEGSILVFWESYEKGIIDELAEKYPEYKEWLLSLKERIVDLNSPFNNFHYYDNKQKGSTSLKVVLPAVTGKSYDSLSIQNGGSAGVNFMRLIGKYGEQLSAEEKAKIIKNLEDYCKLDTEGMIWILEELRKCVGGEGEENR